MAKLICKLEGVRGREMKLYDTKCVITTNKTVGSFITGNITDGEKTIFLSDVVGVQFKESGALIGYLQFETPSMQMNNKNDNMFSENTFTFEHGKNGVTNVLMKKVYSYVVDRIEELKYGTPIITDTPDFESMKDYDKKSFKVAIKDVSKAEDNPAETEYDAEGYIDIDCPKCGETISLLADEKNVTCPWCETEINLK